VYKEFNMNKKKEIDKLARLTVLANFVNSKLKEQKNLVKSFVTEEDKVLKGVEHKLNVIIRSYKRFDSEAFRKDQPEVYNDYKTKVVSSMELKPFIDGKLSVNANPIAVRHITRIFYLFLFIHALEHRYGGDCTPYRNRSPFSITTYIFI
jgi:hypothetical protein